MFTRSQYDAIAKAIACARILLKSNPTADPLNILADEFADCYETRDRFGTYSEFMNKSCDQYELVAVTNDRAEFRLKGSNGNASGRNT